MKNNMARYYYTFFGVNRGLVLSIALPIGLAIVIYLLDISIQGGFVSSLVLILGYIIFLYLHISWDRKIKSKHLPVDIQDDHLTFYGSDEQQYTVQIEKIDKIEVFPTPDNIYDEDYISNMMSSGIRLYSAGEKFLIFSKIKNYNEIKEKLGMR